MRAPWRSALTLFGLLLGLLFGYYLMRALTHGGVSFTAFQQIGAALVLGALGGFLGFFSAAALDRAMRRLNGYMERRVSHFTAQELISGGVGLLFGLLAAFLLSTPLNAIPIVGNILPILFAIFLGYVGGYLGLGVARKRRAEDPLVPEKTSVRGKATRSTPKVVDTSVVIDGRIADILETGFIEGPIIVPQFILDELRHIADSADVLKRNRGRRGLDVLNRIQKEMDVTVRIEDKDFPGLEVDMKLLRLAKHMDGKVLTNDFNLNKVAALQNVPVLNINELANAVKPVVLPGEEMVVHIIKDGKEPGQGVAYLDDGTMIVVDSGKKYIGETIPVLVTSVLQTAAGRMIFAKPKSGERQEPNGNRVQAQP
ncbi:MAG: TRAM domain-containing protein [Thermaerobacter sp.]|nr:TRAM domain-containing protein [Thermaerobacter sp.]